MSLDRPAIVAAIIVHAGRTLLVRRRQREGSLSWQFPAGEREPGETPFDTAVRETAEEVGLPITPIVLIGERQHPATGRHMFYVGCEAATDSASLVDADELAELAWCDDRDVTAKIPSGLYEPVADYLRTRLTRP
ncbi:NUDIX hydrolase [Allorhizocola rhizosphaerae]|uniref:NUDIX hydrolase n=1 Tax=Allorhizocola rhizosphaerae TaxID=1872709 RepID=UPI000E3C0930|nr:NUDIX hydrolase [Allorhizocola rhizosphaerae]